MQPKIGADPVPVQVFNKTTNETTTALLYYRGKRNLDAILLYLRTHHNLGAATEVLLSGGSAGGLTAYLHADVLKRLRKVLDWTWFCRPLCF
jgi:hypothetical protein